MITIHILIKGKVQGVFYRVSAAEAAKDLGITGWVKNTPKGDVEAMVTGPEEQVQHFIKWCRRGPEKAKVNEVITAGQPLTNFRAFDVLR